MSESMVGLNRLPYWVEKYAKLLVRFDDLEDELNRAPSGDISALWHRWIKKYKNVVGKISNMKQELVDHYDKNDFGKLARAARQERLSDEACLGRPLAASVVETRYESADTFVTDRIIAAVLKAEKIRG